MNKLTNDIVASKLEEIGILLRLAGANEFKAIAFDRAARTIEGLQEDIADIINDKKLTSIKGIGKSIAQDIYTYAETGNIPVLDDLKNKVPEGLIKWLSISGLGPKKIYKIHSELNITEIDELKDKCKDGSVASLSGMGAKSAEKILKSIEWMEQFSERCHLDEAMHIADAMVESLSGLDGVQRISVAGSLRRRTETIGDIDILIAAEGDDINSIFDIFTSHPSVVEILGRGDTKSSVRTNEGRQADLRIVKPEQFPAALMYFTGSKEHNVVMRQRARDRNMALNEYGLFKLNSEGNTDFDSPVKTSSEKDIYENVGLHFVPPELREDRNEFNWFEENSEVNLLEEKDIKGVLHAHSTYSDGKKSILEMAEACIDRGYEYLGITDHSRTAAYAGGLSIDSLKKQWEEIDRINNSFQKEGVNFTVLKGIESDILSDGSLDYPEEILKEFDFIIASVHSSLEMPADKMLDRYKKAIENPYTSIVGHPTGRLLLRRDGSSVDINKLIEFAVEHDTAIEINANPWRLDLDWRYGLKAKKEGLMSAICPDAHTIEGIDDIKYGVAIARKGWFEKERILNTKSAENLLAWFKKGKG